MGELAGLIRDERLRLVTLLEDLAPEEWATPSLCAGWSVLDVAGHLAGASALRTAQAVRTGLRHGLRMNRVNDVTAEQWAAKGPEAVVAQLRANAASGARPPGTTELMALTDAVVHPVDIRRPLGRSVPLEPAPFVRVADFIAGLRWPMTVPIGGRGVAASRGVRLVADDLDWSHGAGPEVRGSAEALLRLLACRPVEPGELTGPGAEQVYERL